MDYVAEITETLNQLKASEESIKKFKLDHQENVDLIDFFMPSSEKLVEMLKIRIKDLEDKLKKEKEMLQEICSHENSYYKNGYMEYEYHDHSYISGYFRCDECGLYVLEDNPRFNALKKIGECR